MDYIKLHRKFREWGWYSDPITKAVFLEILLTANWKDGEYLGRKVKAGQAVVGINSLANTLGLTVQNVRTALKHLESTGEITRESTNKFTVVTIVNWGVYQSRDDNLTNDQQTTNNQLTSNSQSTNNIQEGKKGRKKENIYIDFNFSEPVLAALKDFEVHRKTIKSPMSDKAKQLLAKKVVELSGGDDRKAIQLISFAIEHGWKSVYPVDEEKLNDTVKVDQSAEIRQRISEYKNEHATVKALMNAVRDTDRDRYLELKTKASWIEDNIRQLEKRLG